MKKLSLIPLVVVVIAGIVFASGILFPDTGILPRLPSTPGTLWGVLGFFQPDGTAPDANMLSGAYASGYLHNKDCSTEPINTVWKWIDANGQAICWNVSGLMAIAHFTEIHGTVNVWHDGTPGYTPAVVGELLYQWDLIESDSTGTGTIAFEEDNSIIRFSTDTDLELQYGDLWWLTVAEVILNDGRLWGRILSSTGVNLWGGGMVTGVRGTSVDVIKDKVTAVYTMTITDSVRTDNLIKKDVTGNSSSLKVYTTSILGPVDIDGGESIPVSTPIATISDTSFWGGTRFTYLSWSTLIKKYTVDKNLFYTDKWFVKNALLDMKHMSTLLATTNDYMLKYRINSELNTTIEMNNTGTLVKLLDGSAPLTGNVIVAADILNQENTLIAWETMDDINSLKLVRLDCKFQWKTYFPGLWGCAGSWDTKAITAFQTFTWTLYGSKNNMTLTVSGSLFSDGIYGKITANGNYLEYNGDFSYLPGKHIIIDLISPIPTPINKNYILDTWTFKVYKKSDNLYYYQLCPITCGTAYQLTAIWPSATTLSIEIPGNLVPNTLVIWSQKIGLAYQFPISTTISNIAVK